MGQDDACLGHADEFHRLLGRHGHAQGVAVRHAHILAGGDDDAPGDEADVLPGVEHFGQPVERRVGIGGTHAFDEGADGVVVGVTVAVVNDRLLLHGLLGSGEGDDDFALRVWLRGEHGEFEGVQAAAGISIRHSGEVMPRIRLDAGLHATQAAFRIAQSAIHE